MEKRDGKNDVKTGVEGMKVPYVSPDEINALYYEYKETGRYDAKLWVEKRLNTKER